MNNVRAVNASSPLGTSPFGDGGKSAPDRVQARDGARTALILGIGNYLMGDEGVGVHAARALESVSLPAGVAVLDGGTGGFHLLRYFQDFEPLFLIDATMDGRPAGTVTLLQPKFASEFPRSLGAHDIGLRDLIETSVMCGGLPKIHLITVSIEAIQSGTTELSPPVRDAIPTVIKAVHAILAREARVAEPATLTGHP